MVQLNRCRSLARAGALFLGLASLCASTAAPPPTATISEDQARASVLTHTTNGLISIQPWAVLLGSHALGVSWVTSKPADGLLEYTQDTTATNWQQAWYSEDGLRQANGTVQKAVIPNYDPSKPLRFHAISREITSFKPYKVTFEPPQQSVQRAFPPILRNREEISFAVFNDVHNRIQNYPLLMEHAEPPIKFAVFNGDVLQDPQNEQELTDYLLKPMAWFTSKSIPCFFLRGNHETRGAFARSLRDYLLLPDNKFYTAMTFGPTRVVFLDTGEDKPDASVEYSGLVDFDPYIARQLTWLKEEINSPEFRKAKWRIVVMHIPPDWRKEDSKLWHGERRVREQFVPLLDQGHVTAVISGHNHYAEMVEPCPDKSRGFQFPVFIGGAPTLTNATLTRVDANVSQLKIRQIRSNGSVTAEKTWDQKVESL